jgi:hypothetical protein
MDLYYVYIAVGWAAASFAAAVFMGHFIQAGKGTSPSQALREDIADTQAKADRSAKAAPGDTEKAAA